MQVIQRLDRPGTRLLAIVGNFLGTVIGILSLDAAIYWYPAVILITASLVLHVLAIQARLFRIQADLPPPLQHQTSGSIWGLAQYIELQPWRATGPSSARSGENLSGSDHDREGLENRRDPERSFLTSFYKGAFWAVFILNLPIACFYAFMCLLAASFLTGGPIRKLDPMGNVSIFTT